MMIQIVGWGMISGPPPDAPTHYSEADLPLISRTDCEANDINYPLSYFEVSAGFGKGNDSGSILH